MDSGSGWGDDLLNSYSFDSLGRVTQITQAGQTGGATVQDKRVDFAYTVDGLFDSITRYKSLAGGSANEVARSEYTRDDLGRITSLEHLHDTTSIADYNFIFDAYSRITQVAATSLVGLAGTTDFTYDTTGQLTAADHTHISDEAYSYDENGNRTNTGYTTGTGNRMTSDGAFNYTYDDNGNRLTKVRISTAPADDQTVEYQWDHRNRLTGIVTKNNSGVVTKEVDYEYDVFNRQVSKSIDADGAGPATAEGTRFVYDGGDILAVTDVSGDITHRMLHGPAVDQILAIEEDATGEVLWGLTDHLGSIRDIVDNDGNVENHIVYDAFGNVVSETAAAVDFLFGFTGRERDEESGLNYHRARYYDTATGRWLSNDPIGFAAGDTNIQRYVGNNPVNYVDPSGLVGEPIEVSISIDVDSGGMWSSGGTSSADDYHGFLDIAWAVTTTFVTEVGSSFSDGRAIDSAMGVIDKEINWVVDQVDVIDVIPEIGIGPVYGHENEYNDGSVVGDYTTTAMDVVQTVAGKPKKPKSGGGLVGVVDDTPSAGGGRGRPSIPPGSKGGEGAGKPVNKKARDREIGDGNTPPLCGYCGVNNGSEVDHVIPRSKGGDLTPGNTVPACRHCNASKGARQVPKTPPANYPPSTPWPPAHWPQDMIDEWHRRYGKK
ncbi:RHS repeat-associated core domain-containing protein [Pirellulaceae bacterium SH501]